MGSAHEAAKVRRLRVRLPAESLDQVALSFKANLSPSGVFLKVPKKFQSGDRVTVEILLADRSLFLTGEGNVTWVGEAAAQGVRGVSCEVQWDAPSQTRVDEILSRSTLPPPPGESPRAPMEQHVTVDSLPAPAPAAPVESDEETESDRVPTVKVTNDAEEIGQALEQEITLDETAESPLSAGFLETPSPTPEGEEHTMESSAPDFAAWADKAGVEAGAETGDMTATSEDGMSEKSGVWRWLKKRFGSNV